MSDSQQLIRDWRLLQRLADSRYGYILSELSAEMDVSQRTIRRDLIVLAQAGFRASESVADRGMKRWRIEAFQESLAFPVMELLSVLVGRPSRLRHWATDSLRFRQRERMPSGRRSVHVWLRSDQPVLGPLLIGAGRYPGHGLFKPLRETHESGQP